MCKAPEVNDLMESAGFVFCGNHMGLLSTTRVYNKNRKRVLIDYYNSADFIDIVIFENTVYKMKLYSTPDSIVEDLKYWLDMDGGADVYGIGSK